MQGVDIHVLCDNKVLQQLTQATFLYASEKTLREKSSVNMKISTVLKDLHAELPGLTMLDFFSYLDD